MRLTSGRDYFFTSATGFVVDLWSAFCLFALAVFLGLLSPMALSPR